MVPGMIRDVECEQRRHGVVGTGQLIDVPRAAGDRRNGLADEDGDTRRHLTPTR